jgi:endoglucanase
MKKASLLFIFLFASLFCMAIPTSIIENIHIDQFGYVPTKQKIAVISSAQIGFYGSPYTPGNAANQYQIRRWSDDAVMYTGTLSVWGGGATHVQSGDKVWWFDFSGLSIAGSYYVYDVATGKSSVRFEINTDVYNPILSAALKTYYLQRCGSNKIATYAGAGYVDIPCHVGTLQDADCRLYNNTNVSTSKNLSGGWHDAGDYNKYVSFAYPALVDLLFAYAENPTIWTDIVGIPESNNGVPDILDEVKYELDWLLKMQQSSGGVLSMVGVVGFSSASPASAHTTQRVYGPETANASISLAAACALASKQFAAIGNITYANTLKTAAENAYNWAEANPTAQFYNTGIISAGEQEVGASSYELAAKKLAAAVYLYGITSNLSYKTYVESNYQNMHLLLWGYAYLYETHTQDALLYYAALSAATPAVKTAINNAYKNSVNTNNAENLPDFLNSTDAYRAYIEDRNCVEGNNSIKALQGLMFSNCIQYNLSTGNNVNYTNAASGFLHYIHGVNPTGFCYLSNMSAYGAEKSVPEIYNSWFANGSALWDRVGASTYGPAPGFLVPGINRNYNVDNCCATNSCGGSNALCNAALVTPPIGQPTLKMYKDFNADWPQNAWLVSENGIYFEASYIKLLSKFITTNNVVLPITLSTFVATVVANERVQLNWKLENEEKVNKYIVQKSDDGISFYDIEHKNNSNSKNYFTYDNDFIQNENFYRLKMIYINGEVEYSDIKKVKKSNKETFEITPNPSTDYIFVQLNNSTFSKSLIATVYNMLGLKILQQEFKVAAGFNKIKIITRDFPKGNYIIKIESNGITTGTKCFIKQ